MKKNILILFLLFFSVTHSFSQSNCKNMDEGIKSYNAKNFNKAITIFKIAKNNSKKGDDCYIKSCFWIAKSYFSINPYSVDVSDFLSKAIRYNDINALRFFSLEYPDYNIIVSSYIDEQAFLEKYDDGEIYFLLGNIYAKNSVVDENKLFNFYLKNAIDNGYKQPILYLMNYISVVNLEKYKTYVGKNFKENPNEFRFEIKSYVEQKINIWQKKGKFEKTATYKKRVNEEARNLEIKELTQLYIDSLGADKIDFKNANNEYDADNEVFKITFNNLNSIYLPVPIKEARTFDSNFKAIKYEEPHFTYFDKKFEILHLEVINPQNNKRYIYDGKDLIAFSSNTLSFNFDNFDITINSKASQNNVTESTNVINVGKSDVDENIPVNQKTHSNKYALIIGNEDYTQYQSGLNTESNVQFARADAKTFSKYCINTLGVPKENIVLLTDAISSQMRREIEKLTKLAKYSDGKAELIFYYAGHGFPNEQTKQSYLIPVDISGADVTSGIELSKLYSQLSKYPSKRVTVFLDACFSGGGRNQGLLAARGVKIRPKENQITGNLIVFSASTGEQSSLPYKQKQHGMFTYFLLKKLQESKGNVLYGDLSTYIKNQVQLNSIKINNKDQNPKILISPTIENNWKNWEIK